MRYKVGPMRDVLKRTSGLELTLPPSPVTRLRSPAPPTTSRGYATLDVVGWDITYHTPKEDTTRLCHGPSRSSWGRRGGGGSVRK